MRGAAEFAGSDQLRLVAAELTTLLESRISNFYTNFQVDEIGRNLFVRLGIGIYYHKHKHK